MNFLYKSRYSWYLFKEMFFLPLSFFGFSLVSYFDPQYQEISWLLFSNVFRRSLFSSTVTVLAKSPSSLTWIIALSSYLSLLPSDAAQDQGTRLGHWSVFSDWHILTHDRWCQIIYFIEYRMKELRQKTPELLKWR